MFTYMFTPLQIRGLNHIFEINESSFSRRKYNRGRIHSTGAKDFWKLGFLLPVSRRNAKSLMIFII